MLSHPVVHPRPLSLLGAIVLVVCLAALLAAPALAVAPTTLTAAANPQVIVYPARAVVSGTISVPGADLSLLARPAGAADYSPAATGKAGAAGAFSFRVRPSVSTDYRVVFAATSTQEAAQADASLHVRPLVTASFPGSLWLGGSVTLRGAVAPAHSGGTVVLDRHVGGAWQQFATTTLDGVPQPAEGTVKVYMLKQPLVVERAPLQREVYWWYGADAPQPDPTKPESWELGEVVAEQHFATDATGSAKPGVLLKAGIYRVVVESKDCFGKTVSGREILEVLDPTASRYGVKLPNCFASPKWCAIQVL